MGQGGAQLVGSEWGAAGLSEWGCGDSWWGLWGSGGEGQNGGDMGTQQGGCGAQVGRGQSGGRWGGVSVGGLWGLRWGQNGGDTGTRGAVRLRWAGLIMWGLLESECGAMVTQMGRAQGGGPMELVGRGQSEGAVGSNVPLSGDAGAGRDQQWGVQVSSPPQPHTGRGAEKGPRGRALSNAHRQQTGQRHTHAPTPPSLARLHRGGSARGSQLLVWGPSALPGCRG